jgi:hypothetical protein|tara:strand:- start:86 stop:424 length:339 start_codon:yes stop_codon:yes gene_type:complete
MAFISPSSVLEMENDEEGDDEDGSLLEIEIFPSTWSNSKSEASKRVAVALTMVSIPFLSRYFVRRLVWILLLPPPRDDERKVLEEQQGEEARMIASFCFAIHKIDDVSMPKF